MTYRTIKIAWHPRRATQWATYSAARKEAARLWNDLVERHFRLRRAQWKWPRKGRWQQWAKGKYPHLHSQSVQQIIGEFVEAVDSARQLRRRGVQDAHYPWKKSRFRDVVYTNQGARMRDGCLLLPNGRAGTLRIKLPAMPLPGRLMEVRLGVLHVTLILRVPEEPRATGPTIGVDVGVNSLLAATDGHTAVVVSGRAVKAVMRYRNKKLAEIVRRQSHRVKG